MAKRSDEEKMLFDDYVSVSTIQRYFGIKKTDADELFVKSKNLDKKKGYLQIYYSKVRSEAVFELLGLDLDLALKRYKIREGKLNESITSY